MKTLIMAGAAGIMIAAAISPAFAYTLSPTGRAFTMLGGFSVSAPTFQLGCIARYKGKVFKNGVGEITFAKFKNGGNCVKSKDILPVGLPWAFKATGMGKGRLIGVAVSVSGTTCGPGTIPVHINNAGIITFNNVSMTGNCTVDGGMRSKPPLSTVP